MTITFKRAKKRYLVTVGEKLFKFSDIHNAHIFLDGILKRGIEHTQEVHEKIHCLYQLYMLKGRPDKRESAVRKMLLACGGSISIDNAIHGVIVGNYTLNDILKSRGFYDEEKQRLAEQVNDFIADYETFGYRADYDAPPDVVKRILAKFDNPETFKRASEIMSNDHYNADQIYVMIKEALR